MIQIAEKIEELVLKEEAERSEKYKGPRDHFWASDVFKCKRQLFYEFKDAPKKALDARALLIFRAGDSFHELVKNYLWRTGILRQEEARLPETARQELNLTGRFDALVSTTLEGERELCEIKSISHFGFEDLDEPKPEWVAQLTIYMHYLNVKRGIIFAINKNTSEMKQWEVIYNPEVFAKIKEYFLDVAKYVKENKEPDRPYARDSWQCGYCKFNGHCWRDCPIPEAPAFKVDETIEPPSQEILESAINTYCSLDEQIKLLKKDYEAAKEIIERYFKTNTEKTVSNLTYTIERIQRQNTDYDIDKLRQGLGPEKFALISKPSSTMIKQALKESLIDPTVVEKAKTYDYSEILKIKKATEEKAEEKKKPEEKIKKKTKSKKEKAE